MTPETWSHVDHYLNGLLVPHDEVLESTLAAAAGLPQIQVTPTQGKFLHILARATGARNILEIGTLAGYSTICLARALPEGGRLTTLESNARHADVARENFARAGLSNIIDLRVGLAIETLPMLLSEGRGPFDFVFIDADKSSLTDYFDWALKLSRRGALIIADNVVRRGAVANPEDLNAAVRGVRRFFDRVAAEPRVSASALQSVGAKGYDGMAFALVIADKP